MQRGRPGAAPRPGQWISFDDTASAVATAPQQPLPVTGDAALWPWRAPLGDNMLQPVSGFGGALGGAAPADANAAFVAAVAAADSRAPPPSAAPSAARGHRGMAMPNGGGSGAGGTSPGWQLPAALLTAGAGASGGTGSGRARLASGDPGASAAQQVCCTIIIYNSSQDMRAEVFGSSRQSIFPARRSVHPVGCCWCCAPPDIQIQKANGTPLFWSVPSLPSSSLLPCDLQVT